MRLPRWGVGWRALTLLVSAWLFWQFRADAAGDYLLDAWNSENGLPHNFVTSIVQTPDGYLWVGTYNGLARFDGSRFVTFQPGGTPQLGHRRIVKLFLDARGTLWINTYDGSLTSWRNGVFTREWNGEGKNISEVWLVASDAREIIFSFRAGLLIRRAATGTARDWQVTQPPGNPPGASYCRDGEGGLWCSTLNGSLWRIKDDKFELVPKDTGLRGKEIHWLAPDSRGRIWVGTEKEMAAWDGARFQNMSPQGEAEMNVVSLSFSQDGRVLVGADGRLRKWFDGKWEAELPAWPDLMQEEQLRSSQYRDREGGLWRVSRGLGIFHIGPDGRSEQISVADGLPGDHTTCWLQDREGNVWIGLGNGGIARLKKKHFIIIDPPAGQPVRPAMSVCEDQAGTLWIGSYGGGLQRWRDGVLTSFPIPTRRPGNFVFSICPSAAGKLWVSAGMEDLFSFQDEQVQPPPVAVHAIKCIIMDRQGGIWMGRNDGVEYWANGQLREWSSHTDSISKPVRALAEDRDGAIWMGADDGNLYRFFNEELRAFPPPPFPGQQAGWSLLADADGTLWIGTSDSGLLHFDAGHFTRFTVKDGLPDDMICQILDDQQGNLWLGTHHGICRVSKASLRAFAAGKSPGVACSVFGRSDGLPTLQCSEMYQPAAWRGQNGQLWFATVKGLVGVQPAQVPLNSQPPPVVVEDLLADGKSQMPTGATGAALKLSPGQQNFEFHYTALSLIDADKTRFRYQLEGFDAELIEAGSRRWVQYNYLKPGKYRFHVIACNNDGLWNQIGAAVSIEVLPQLWETWWFRSLLSVTLVAGVAVAARHLGQREWNREMERLERQRDLEKDRARIARDIHDHIGSGLTRINLLNELRLGEPPEQSNHRAEQITSVTCELMQSMDEIVWAVNPKNDTLESLMNYLGDYADEYLRMAQIRLRFDVPTPLPASHLTSEVRHNLFLAVKEILNNIVKHSGASEVTLALALKSHAVTLAIQDTGRGFVQDLSFSLSSTSGPRVHGNGLENLQKRAASIGGECRIQSEPGKGTRIEFVIPITAVNGRH